MTGSLASSLRLQSTIIHALIMQDMNRRYAQSRLGSLMALVEPLLLVAGLYVVRVALRNSTQIAGVPLALFLVTGLLIYYCFRLAAVSVMTAGRRRTAALMFPQVSTLDPMLAQAATSCVIYATVMMIAFAALVLSTGVMPRNPLLVLAASSLSLATACALGLLLGALLRLLPDLRLIIGMLLRIDLFFSGAMYLASELPSGLLPYVAWNPTFHAIELMREAWFPGYVSPSVDPAYAVEVLIVLLTAGLSLERITSARTPG